MSTVIQFPSPRADYASFRGASGAVPAGRPGLGKSANPFNAAERQARILDALFGSAR